MPVYCKTESGWKQVLLMWAKQASGWSMVNPLYIKKSEVRWEALPFGTMLASAVTGPANGSVFRAGSTVGIGVSAISSSGFADAGAGTQIQIAMDAGFASIASAYDGAYATSWTSAALHTAGTYYVRVRHRGANLGWGPWSGASWFSVAAAVGTVGFSSSTTWTVPYDGTFTIFTCGGGGGGGAGHSGDRQGSGKGGGAGGNSSVNTISGSSVSVVASGGAGGGSSGWSYYSSGAESDITGVGYAGASSSWYTGGAAGSDQDRRQGGGNGGGGTGSSPYGIGGEGGNKGYDQHGGNGGNGGTASSSVWLAQGTVLQIVIGGGGSGGDFVFSGYRGKPGSAGVVYITG